MSQDPHEKDKVEEEGDIKKTREYRKFRKLLKKVIKAPPLRKPKAHTLNGQETQQAQ